EGFGDHCYGFPSEDGSATFKVGYHTPGPATDPDEPGREPQPAAIDAILQRVEARFHEHNPVVVETGVCLYTNAANDDFVIGWLDGKTLVASPCSGHGFKFGPWMGRFLADLVEEKRSIDDWPRWKWAP
ncbi:MAG: FAD-dependent oxidoreductase, partial [Armatimonadetes bacterium]|nr:FAD-dependent oxidoreductase [Armatimonadota bacterium]